MRVVQENGAFTVTVRMLNHLTVNKRRDPGAAASGEASSIESVSEMIGGLAEKFSIPAACISINFVMENFRDGTRH